MAGHYIEDGQTLPGYVAEVPRLYGPVRFQFRPMLATERAVILGQMSVMGEKEATETAAAIIASRVKQWDATRGDGATIIPLDPAHTVRLQPKLQMRIYNIILGNEAPDQDPRESGPNEDPEAATRELAAAIAGDVSPGKTQEGREKNSGKG